MLSRRVDLTENSDFGGGRLIDFIRLDEIFTQDVRETRSRLNSRNMSLDEYETILRYENFFGRKTHYTEFLDIFKSSYEDYINEERTHCQRCGAELKTPWNNFYGLCRECNERMKWENMRGAYNVDDKPNFPWTIHIPWRRDPKEILQMR